MRKAKLIHRKSFLDTPTPKRRDRTNLIDDDSDLYPKLLCFLIGIAVGILVTGMYVHIHYFK